MAERLTVLVAARDEERSIEATVSALREGFPDAEILVADDGSRDGTAAAGERAGARVVRLPRLGKGQALTLAEREAAAGPLLLCDADLQGDLAALLDEDTDLAIAAFEQREGGGFGIAKRAARELIRLLSGFEAREPLSGQRALSPKAREECFPLAPGFGCEVRMTIDAVRAGLEVRERDLPLRHRATGRDLSGFLHRADHRNAEGRRDPALRPGANAQPLGSASGRTRGQPLQPARHRARPGAQAVPDPRSARPRTPPACRPDRALRSPRDDDAR